MLDWISKSQYPLFLAPMARFTDTVFRQLCKKQGADVMVTEFVQADAIIRGDDRLWETVDFTESQRPMGVQIFGSEPTNMAEASKRIVQKIKPDFIDINCGCPADRVTSMNAGSSLLKDPTTLGKIIASVVSAVPNTPVTLKIRIGWDDRSINAHEIGAIAESEGAQMLTIHGRTKAQGYQGDANWPVITAVASNLKIPVIGNGSIASAEDVLKIKNETNCAGVMIGRAALGYPWIFRDIKYSLRTGKMPKPISLPERWRTIIDYTEKVMLRSYSKERHLDIKWMRPKVIALTKELPGSRKIRTELGKVIQIDDLRKLADLHIQHFSEHNYFKSRNQK